jgi:magnesium chelatase family protein
MVTPDVLAQSPQGEASEQVRQRVVRARDRQRQRQGVLNAELTPTLLEQHAQAEAPAMVFLQSACSRLGWSGRAFHRVLKLARTIADLNGADSVAQSHVAEAIQYRRVLQTVS